MNAKLRVWDVFTLLYEVNTEREADVYFLKVRSNEHVSVHRRNRGGEDIHITLQFSVSFLTCHGGRVSILPEKTKKKRELISSGSLIHSEKDDIQASECLLYT